MNVRFSERSVRCRVKPEEFEQLLKGRAIALDLALPRDHVFRVNVRPSTIGGWELDSDPTGLWIAIPRADLVALAEAMPSKEGITHAFETAGGEATLAFEVDVKKPRGAATAPVVG